MRPTFPTLALAMALAAGCAASPAGPAGPMLPTPYTAEQIRSNYPPGTLHVYLHEQPDQPPVLSKTVFVEDDGERATFEMSRILPDGTSLGEAETATERWTELRDHAAFDAGVTTRREASCTVRSGSYDCWLYEKTEEARGGPILHRFWFAKSKPGPPVLYEQVRGDEVTYRMEMIEFRRPG